MPKRVDVKFPPPEKAITGVVLDRFPHSCPWCRQVIDTEIEAAFFPYRWEKSTNSNHIKTLYAVFQCTNTECGRIFISEYSLDEAQPNLNNYLFKSSYPGTFEEETFPDEVKNVSGKFVEIYNQALQAELLGLTHIAGPGFGKALEFLVKDHAIRENPGERNKIEEKFLGVCLSTRQKPKTEVQVRLFGCRVSEQMSEVV